MELAMRDTASRIALATGFRHRKGFCRAGSLRSPGERVELIRKGGGGRRLSQSDVIISVKSFLNGAFYGILLAALVRGGQFASGATSRKGSPRPASTMRVRRLLGVGDLGRG